MTPKLPRPVTVSQSMIYPRRAADSGLIMLWPQSTFIDNDPETFTRWARYELYSPWEGYSGLWLNPEFPVLVNYEYGSQ